MKNKTLLIILISVFLIACDEGSNTTEPENEFDDEIMPLAVGNYWDYEIYNYLEDESHINRTFEILTDTVANGEKWFILKYFYEYGIERKGIDALGKNEKGVEHAAYYEDNGEFLKRTQFLLYPCEKGDRFNMDTDKKDTTIVESVSKEIEFEGKKRNSIHYRHINNYTNLEGENQSFFTEIFAVPGIGIVHIFHYEVKSNGDTLMKREQSLIDYKLN